MLNLWAGKDFPTKAILLVTHNIEEAVQMADRIFVLSTNPGKFKAEIHCDLARPRNRRGPEFEALVDQIYGIMTEQVTPDAGHQTTVVEPGLESPTDLPLPRASVGELAGLLEILDKRGGRDDLPKLAQHLTFEVDDLLPLVDAAEMLGFATVADADIELTPRAKPWPRRTSRPPRNCSRPPPANEHRWSGPSRGPWKRPTTGPCPECPEPR
ncbi:MAG TPA: AAA-associated domain-containing protein [Streptosporangiaceae bacterium]|nr:AAA-associated domain-containing protein [Streptosporangiaceae bacterium]